MTDPRLNSVHLEAQRRELFRRAREGLVEARGDLTLVAEKVKDLSGPTSDSKAMIAKARTRLPPGLHFGLVDKDSFFPLKVGINTIGRMTDNDIVLPDAFISRRHCAILVHATDGCELHDIASKNGTFVNGHHLTGPTPLVCGDEIGLCERPFIFVSSSDPPPSSTTQPD